MKVLNIYIFLITFDNITFLFLFIFIYVHYTFFFPEQIVTKGSQMA